MFGQDIDDPSLIDDASPVRDPNWYRSGVCKHSRRSIASLCDISRWTTSYSWATGDCRIDSNKRVRPMSFLTPSRLFCTTVSPLLVGWLVEIFRCMRPWAAIAVRATNGPVEWDRPLALSHQSLVSVPCSAADFQLIFQQSILCFYRYPRPKNRYY